MIVLDQMKEFIWLFIQASRDKKSDKKKNQIEAGMGLLELMFALAIIALLLLGAIKYYQAVRVSSSSNEAMKQITSIIAVSERWAAAHQGSFSGIVDITTLIEAELLPETFSKNAWGGEVNIRALAADQIKITLTNLPIQVCNNLGHKLNIPLTILEKQCVDTEDSRATLLYCYPDTNKCLM